MRYHIVLGKSLDFGKIRSEAESDLAPGHVMMDLGRALDAQVHMPGGMRVRGGDRVMAKLIGTAEQWALAREVAERVEEGDVVFCTGEDVGLPVARECWRRRNGARVVVFGHNVDRWRVKGALAWLGCGAGVAKWLTNARRQERYLLKGMGLPRERVGFVMEQTDTGFFVPGVRNVGRGMKVVASAGLECRDYKTLAEATEGLGVEVRISGFSRDARVLRRAFPKEMPGHMSRKFYSWVELRQLYRDADLVVVSLFDNGFCAGLTTFLEASACGCPTVISQSKGLEGYIEGIGRTVKPGNVQEMRQAIEELLSDGNKAREMGERAYQQIRMKHGPEAWLETMEHELRGVGGESPVLRGK